MTNVKVHALEKTGSTGQVFVRDTTSNDGGAYATPVGGSGSGVNTQIAYWTGASTLSSTGLLTTDNSTVVTLNDAGGNVDFRVEGDTDTNLLVTDASTDCVGIGVLLPLNKLHVEINSTGGVGRIANTNAAGFAAIDFYNNGTQRFSFGHALAAFGQLNGKGYMYSTNSSIVFIAGDSAATAAYSNLEMSSTGTVLNETGANLDFRVEGNGRANLLFLDANAGTGGRVGINRTAGNVNATLDIDNTSVAEAILTCRDNGTVFFTVLDGGNVGASVTAPTSALHTTAFAAATNSVSIDTTLTTAHHTLRVDATSANRTVTLPAASGCSGRIYVVKKIDSSGNTVTIDGNASETIDGALTKVLTAQYEKTMIQSNGSSWDVLA